MLCEKCKEKKASIHLTELVNGKKRDLKLCDDCANKEKSINFNLDFNMPFHMKDIFSSIMEAGNNKDAYKNDENHCDYCKSTYSRFKDIGRLGCYKCYDKFKNNLLPLIKRVQGTTEHVGKIPKRIGGPLKIKNRISRLRLELNRYIANEEFEKAAQVRDKIKELEKFM